MLDEVTPMQGIRRWKKAHEKFPSSATPCPEVPTPGDRFYIVFKSYYTHTSKYLFPFA